MSWSKEKRSTKRRSSKRRSDKRGSNEMRSIKRSSNKRTSNREQVECKKKVEQWNVGKEKVDTENIGRSKEVRMIEGRLRVEGLKLLKKSCICNQVYTQTQTPHFQPMSGAPRPCIGFFSTNLTFSCSDVSLTRPSRIRPQQSFPFFLLSYLRCCSTFLRAAQTSPPPTPHQVQELRAELSNRQTVDVIEELETANERVVW